MKKINTLINSYEKSIQQTEIKKFKKHEELKAKIKISKDHLQEFREYIGSLTFEYEKDEISFFKYIKPKICGELNFYRRQLEYIQEKPSISIEGQKDFVKKTLRKLELKKKKNLLFYRYLKQEETVFDELYFVRGKEQLELFSASEFLDTDTRFTTSHDLLASEVVTYDLLTQFYKQELHCLANLEAGCYNTNTANIVSENFIWTASKTDLVELIYALKVSGAINGGDTQIKDITEVFGQLFKVDLGNYYKTYSDIKNRQSNQTKFLSNLSVNLISKLEIDDI